ncbi:MAG: PHP domain-containing protein [Desulfovibrio sp.]|jgi:predicted metal-dependent phosphoesterase TrpH|nr:PHP domain-containing protein [Desulfovibrio sp.]
MSLIDLHTHSTASDGSDCPARLVDAARAAGLAAIALTDHDTTAGLNEAEAAGRDSGITVIRGCELSTVVENDTLRMHLLGLWLPRDTGDLQARLQDLRVKRDARNDRIVALLRECGLDISMEDVRGQARGESVCRPHIAAALLAKGYVKTPAEAFRLYLGRQGRAYVPKEVMKDEDAVRMLAGLGATVCLAHPMLDKPPPDKLEALVARLIPQGLSAIEIWHSEHSAEDTRAALDLARRFGLGLSGGSDYHGLNKPGIRPGVGRGNLRVGTDVLENLVRLRRKRGLPVYNN